MIKKDNKRVIITLNKESVLNLKILQSVLNTKQNSKIFNLLLNDYILDIVNILNGGNGGKKCG